MTVSSSSHPLARLGTRVARRLLGISVPFVGLLVVLAMAAWTMPGLNSRGVAIPADAIFAPRTRR
jgi:hypothetical protein